VHSSYSKFILYINYHPYFITFLTNNFSLIPISTTIHYFILIYIIIIFYFSLCNNNKQNKIRKSEFLKINKIIPFYFHFFFFPSLFPFFSFFLLFLISSHSLTIHSSLSLSVGGGWRHRAHNGGPRWLQREVLRARQLWRGFGGVWGETARSSLRGARGGAVAGGVVAAVEGRQRDELAATVGSFLLHRHGAKGARRCPSAA
jgi:hypothetical protein